MKTKEFINKVLTGMSIGIVVALVPSALLGEIAKAFELTQIIEITTLASRLLGLIIGLCVAMQFKFSPIQTGTLAITTMIGSGAFQIVDGVYTLGGIGDVINAGLTAAITTLMLLAIGNKLKTYTILLVPTLVITVGGFLGLTMLPYVSSITTYLGEIVNAFTNFQPIIMGILIAVTFALLIISPVSTVGVAMAIQLAGIGSGAANLGICAAGFGLAIAGFKLNGLGTSAAHFLGSPKIQMANFVRKPMIILPIICNAAILGALAGMFNIQGTPFSAGFGFSGLIGPLNYLGIAGYEISNILIAVVVFFVLPIVLGFVFKLIFIDKLGLLKEEDYKIDFE